MFRISTNLMFDRSTSSMLRQSSELLKTSQQLSSGKRILTPSDDPSGAARALALSQSIAINDQMIRNQAYAQETMQLLEGTLAGVTENLQHLRERFIYGANGTLSAADRQIIARELREQFGTLLALGNARDIHGNYMFGGHESNAPPFQGDLATGVTYVGDDGVREMRVSLSRDIGVTLPGQAVFGDLFATVADFITALEGPVPEEGGLSVALDRGISGLDRALDNVLNVRARIGAHAVELEQLGLISEETDLQLRTMLANYQEIDYAEAISRFARQQTMLQAAQQTFMKISGLTLFSYLQ